MKNRNINTKYVKVGELNPAIYNPRKWSEKKITELTESIEKFGFIDPIIVNSAINRKNIVIGGHFRLKIAKDLKIVEIPVVYIDIPDEIKEKELNIRLNKNTGDWDFEMLADFDEAFLSNVGFSSEEIDDIFPTEIQDEVFDLKKELEKLDIKKVSVEKGDIYQLGEGRLICGDSTDEISMKALFDGERADMCMTDPPYILDYLKAKRHGKPTEGFGAKKNRKYLETDTLPDDFTEKWMRNIFKIAEDDFSIIVYENWKNLRVIWGEMEKYWRVNNMLVWHIPNRHQGFASKYRFFSKHDIAMVGSTDEKKIELSNDSELFENEYQTALYAMSGKPHWEGYEKGKKIQPTDFVDHKACDEKQSGQGIIFGTKPVEILIPYIKVLTRRGDLVVEPFGGSGSTLIASEMIGRRCYLVEKSPVYAQVIIKRWENFSGKKAVKIKGCNDQS